MLPKTLETIAVPAFDNVTIRYKLTDRLPAAISREFSSRTRYRVIHDANRADAVLRGAVVNILTFPVIFDQQTGRATGIQMNVIMQISLIERESGRILFQQPNLEFRQRYESSVSQSAYFEESEVALARLSQEVARSVVSSVLEAF
jgi:hypothetical protein